MSTVVHRVGYFERVSRVNDLGDQKPVIKRLPFYRVLVPGLSGRLFEAIDCYERRAAPGDGTFALKEIHELIEYDPKQKMFYCETPPDGTDCMLHAFGGCDWPQ